VGGNSVPLCSHAGKPPTGYYCSGKIVAPSQTGYLDLGLGARD
jgi:hypothetical protein